MTLSEQQAFIDRYADGPQALASCLAQAPRAMWRFRPAAGVWSVHEILVHLADSEANAFLRIRLLLAEPGGALMAYDQDRWAEVLDYHSQDPDLAVEIVKLVRRSTTALLRGRLPLDPTLSVSHAEYEEPYTLAQWLAVYASHIEEHIDQIQNNLAAWRAAGSPVEAS